MSINEFVPADVLEPQPDDDDAASLELATAVLTVDRKLALHHQGDVPEGATVSVALRAGSESHPRCTLPILRFNDHQATVSVPESATQDLHGALIASLVAQRGADREEGPPTWVIQEHRLTQEHGDGAGDRSRTRVEETGEGLTEFLDELGKREGVTSVVEYLNHLNIRFMDGGGGLGRTGAFRLRRSDPFHPDLPPEWWDQIDPHASDLESAIYGFCDRHDKKRLRKHAARGNINGIENFLDIFTAIVRLLYVYMCRLDTHRRPIVKKPQFIGRVCRMLDIATCGIDERDDQCPGYLVTLQDNLRGDDGLLRERLVEVNYCGHIAAALLLAQIARFNPNEMPLFGPRATRSGDCLGHQVKKVGASVTEAIGQMPSRDQVRQALDQYNMISEDKMPSMIAEVG